jgi:hypothetical protein
VFETYTRHVRQLSYSPLDLENDLENTVFDAIARSRTTLNILPNMHTVHWSGRFKSSLVFMHGSVKKFTYRDIGFSDDFELESPEHCFMEFYRMPNLTSLSIGCSFVMKEAEVVAGAVFASLSKLQDLCLSPFQLTPRIVESLSRLQDLRAIDCFDIHADWGGEELDTENFKPRLMPGAFPSLERLSFHASFWDAITFFETRFGPGRLSDLSIQS